MNRRGILGCVIAAIGASLFLSRYVMKMNIRHFGKTFEYLKNPDLRLKETGDAPLTIEGAEFSGERFAEITWRKVKFVNCDFVGAYEVRPDGIEDALFEDCRFAGIFNLGVLKKVRFLRCKISGKSHLVGDMDSVDVLFERCELMGEDPDPNHWGSFGTYGEAAFIQCKARLTKLAADTKMLMRDCEFEDVRCGITKDAGGADVLIEKCKLRGLFNMVPCYFQSLIIRDTEFDKIDLYNATIKGDVLIERVKGGLAKFTINEGAQSFTLRDSTINGGDTGNRLISVYAGAFKRVLVENVVFADRIGLWVGIGGGYEIADKNPQPVMTESIVFKNVKAGNFRSAGLNAGTVRIEQCRFVHAEFYESKIDELVITGTTITTSVDFTRTQVLKTQRINLSAGGGFAGRQDKLEGSNVRLAPRS